ncbi:MAG: tyrosine-type recombinase/integrase [Acidobacteria bacterium]|nr:tyrosine-type recombinase/integrase [Acidobacteriota bacterium]
MNLIPFSPIETFCLKNTSPHTQSTYRRVLREFFGYLKISDPREVKPEHVIQWRDALQARKQKPATINLKLGVVRSLYEYLLQSGQVARNPAHTKLVRVFALPETITGRVLEDWEVKRLLAAPHKDKVEGQRDYCIFLIMLRMALRVSEVCSLRQNSLRWTRDGWVIELKVKGGRQRLLPLPGDVKREIDRYLQLDQRRRVIQHSDNEDSAIFQPVVNYATLVYNKPLTPRQVQRLLAKWASYVGLKKITPHDLRRTAITKALDQGIPYREVQMMSGHKDPKTVMRYDHHRENLARNPIHSLKYD